MPRYRAAGSGAVIETKAPLIAWGQHTGDQAEAPKYRSGPGKTDRIEHLHQAPAGQRSSYDGRTAPRNSSSGSNFSGPASGKSPGKSAAANVTAKVRADKPANPGLYTKRQNTFDKPSRIGGGFSRPMKKARD
jgi:hypothetical protein